jgi:hypothetical protein
MMQVLDLTAQSILKTLYIYTSVVKFLNSFLQFSVFFELLSVPYLIDVSHIPLRSYFAET